MSPGPSIALLLAWTATAGAESSLSLRLSAAAGAFDELTWAAPGVDVVGSFDLGARGFLAVAAGYAPLDNHDFLSDGCLFRAGAAGGLALGTHTRLAAALDLELVAFHSDPDVLARHPGVDLVVRRGGVLPTAGLELSRALTPQIAAGAFARLGLRELTVFETASERERARLMLVGAFVEFRLW